MKQEKKPFFVRFLEKQDLSKVKTSLKAGVTHKFPSDADEPQWEEPP